MSRENYFLGIRGYPNRRGNNLSPLSSPGVNPLGGPPLQGYSSKPATKHNLSDEMQLDEALAEFNKMELLLADSFKTVSMLIAIASVAAFSSLES